MSLKHITYRPDIDGLRTLAVLSVVLFHAFPKKMPGGFIGVDIFFVISGFLISTIIFQSLAHHEFSFMDFYARRIRRLFPALITVLLSTFIVGWFVLNPEEYKQVGKHMIGGALFISNVVLWNESGYFDVAAETKPLLHLWSLGIEEQFYILFPLASWLIWRARFNWLGFVLISALVSFSLNLMYINTNPISTFYQPQFRFWELMIGSLIALIMADLPSPVRRRHDNLGLGIGQKFNSYRTEAIKTNACRQFALLSRNSLIFSILQRSIHGGCEQRSAENQGVATHKVKLSTGSKILANIKACLGLALIIAGLLLINKNIHFPGQWALFPTIGTALIIWAGAEAFVNRIILSNRIAVWIGTISYPLYLWHWPILVYLRTLHEHNSPSYLMRAGALVLSFILAWATHRLIETKIRLGRSLQPQVSIAL